MATGMFSGGAAFGVFPQMQPRRRLQDPEGSANVPLDVTRGRFAGLAGLLPDALNFMGRSPMPTEMFGDTQYEPTQQLPYGSEYYLQNLPLKPTSRIGEVAGQAGAFVPLNPMPAARAVAAGARALGPTAVGMGERYLQRQGLMPAVVEGESVGMLGGPIKPQAPVSPIGFYSAAEQAALALPRKSGTGDAFLNDLMKGQDVKKDELSWMGLDDYLKGKPNVTRQEVQDYIAGNRVDVQEVRLGAAVAEDPVGIAQRKAVFDKYEPQIQALYKDMDSFGYDTPRAVLQSTDNRLRKLQEMRDAEADAFYKIPEPEPTKYERYQLPGGENYREILLTLPAKTKSLPEGFNVDAYSVNGETKYGVYDAAGNRYASGLTKDEALQKFNQVHVEKKSYTSSHFDQPNILAHMRVNDRIDADGKKMLLIEEVQSDWHQAGREKGYASKDIEAQLAVIEDQMAQRGNEMRRLRSRMAALDDSQLDEFNALANERERLQILQGEASDLGNKLLDARSEGVPDAPFKGTWHQLALKRALKYAADNGYDRVGLTTGKQQVERYANELRQNVDKIDFEKSAVNFPVKLDTPNIQITASKNGKETFSGAVSRGKFIDGPAAGKTVEEVLGKSMAKQIAEHKQDVGAIKGDDLTIGGEGMKAYYDQIYPAFFEKQGKKYNAKTGETTIGKKGTIQRSGTSYSQTFDTKATVRYIDISPEMRGGVKKGQPLFTAAPIGGIGLGAGTQDNEMPDAVRQYMANPMYSDPFADSTR